MLRPRKSSGLKVISVPSLSHENVPFTLPSDPLNEKLDSTLCMSMGWLNVSLMAGSRGGNSSTEGSSLTTPGREVVNFQVEAPPPGKPTPATVFNSGFRLTVYTVPPDIPDSG